MWETLVSKIAEGISAQEGRILTLAGNMTSKMKLGVASPEVVVISRKSRGPKCRRTYKGRFILPNSTQICELVVNCINRV